MSQNKVTSLSDIPFKEDCYDFGTERYVKGLINFIENSSAPITIALQGEWGSGKTSLMNKLYDALCGNEEPEKKETKEKKDDKTFVGIKVNTWEYSMLSSPEITVVRILEFLVDSIAKSNPELLSRAKNLMRGIVNATVGFGREAVKIAAGDNGARIIEALGVKTRVFESEKEAIPSISDLREEIEKAINELIKKSSKKDNKKKGVIIFVDDLDRLNPPVAVEILELLKNIFTLNNCIFVLAIDYDVVVKGLEPKFGKLTDKNEREFRSFFDKIIQVPFSLPVSSYRPMDFILKSLADIDFLTETEISKPEVKERFGSVIEASVGKNPRSIKRLINTLSLLDCIDRAGEESDKTEAKVNEKLLKLIIVAFQISYPQIYRLLEHNPAFTAWDIDFAHEEGIIIKTDDPVGMEWEDIIEALCSSDYYLNQHVQQIIKLLKTIPEVLGDDKIADPDTIRTELKKILDKSSVTVVNSNFQVEDFDKQAFIKKLHTYVPQRMKELCPDITKWDLKNATKTGKGGLNIWYDETSHFEVPFTVELNSHNEISLLIRLDLFVARPERFLGKSFDEMLQDKYLTDELARIDSVISPLLTSETFFKGRVRPGQSTHFPSYTDDLRYIHEKGWQPKLVSDKPEYRIELNSPALFEDPKVIDTIARLLVANYKYRRAMKDWK